MEPGRLDRRIEIQQSTTTVDSWNQPSHSWATAYTVWAHVKDVGAGEREESDQRVTLRRKQYTIRYNSAVTVQDRISDGGDFYYITSLVTIGRNEGLVISAEARDND